MHRALSSGAASLDRSLELFLAILGSGDVKLSTVAAAAGIPAATAHRMVGAFMRRGLLSRTGRGVYAPGLRLAAIGAGIDTRQVLAAAGRPILQSLAKALGTTVHLGVLEGDMVTYLVKQHGGGAALRTGETMQLEAYCTAIGKVLLAALPPAALALYLSGESFIRLTPATITDTTALRAQLEEIAMAGHAADRAEFEDGLYCLAVPVHGCGGGVVGALSASSFADHCDSLAWRGCLHAAAARLGRRLGQVPAPQTAARDGVSR